VEIRGFADFCRKEKNKRLMGLISLERVRENSTQMNKRNKQRIMRII